MLICLVIVWFRLFSANSKNKKEIKTVDMLALVSCHLLVANSKMKKAEICCHGKLGLISTRGQCESQKKEGNLLYLVWFSVVF